MRIDNLTASTVALRQRTGLFAAHIDPLAVEAHEVAAFLQFKEFSGPIEPCFELDDAGRIEGAASLRLDNVKSKPAQIGIKPKPFGSGVWVPTGKKEVAVEHDVGAIASTHQRLSSHAKPSASAVDLAAVCFVRTIDAARAHAIGVSW